MTIFAVVYARTRLGGAMPTRTGRGGAEPTEPMMMMPASLGRRRASAASYRVIDDSTPVSTTALRGLMASLASRSASPWTAMSMRDRPAGVRDLRQQLVRRCVWQWTVAGRRPTVDGLLVAIG